VNHFHRPLPELHTKSFLPALSLALLLVGCPQWGPGPANSGVQSPPSQPSSRDSKDCPEPNVGPSEELPPRLLPSSSGSSDVLPESASLSHAVQLYDDRQLEAGLAEAGEVLAELQRHGVDSIALRQLLGTWALEAEDGEQAERHFAGVIASQESSQLLLEQAQRGLRDAQVMAYGADAVTLADAQALYADEQWQAAEELLKQLFLGGEDGDVLREAEQVRDQMRAAATALGAALMGEADQILSGSGPYDGVGPLLLRIETLPGGSWNSLELERLRRWYSESDGAAALSGSVVTVPEASSFEALEATLAEARSLVAAMRYRDALAQFAQLEGSVLQDTARQEAAAAADTLVKEERVRAGRLFVAARKERQAAAKVAALSEVHALLLGLLTDFPDSKYQRRAQDNLASVERELNAARELLGPDADSPSP
jgi:hypothetical protein